MDNKLMILLVLAAIAIAVAPAFAEGKGKQNKHMATTSSTMVSSTNAVEPRVNPPMGGTNTAGPNSGRSTELNPDGTSLTGSTINNSYNLPSAQPRVGQ